MVPTAEHGRRAPLVPLRQVVGQLLRRARRHDVPRHPDHVADAPVDRGVALVVAQGVHQVDGEPVIEGCFVALQQHPLPVCPAQVPVELAPDGGGF
ncbi:hypothetical protein D9M70_539510 [compost metagenome]